MAEREQGAGALAGLKVLDLTRILAGPFCTQLLGDLGADVIKIEQPGKGDDTRAWGPPFAGGESAYFLGVNRNKRSVTLNIKSPEGRDLLRRLAVRSDVLIENFRPDTLAELGLDEAWRRAEAPHLIQCSISGYGAEGPYAGRPGYDFILQAQSGLMSITGAEDGEPMKLGVAIVDLCTGLYAANAILAALAARERGGQGQRVEACLYDTGIALLANVAANHLVSGEAPARYGNGHPNIVPYRNYPTRDGQIVVTVGNDAQFEHFARLVGHAEWSADPRFRRNAERIAHRAVLDGLVAEALQARDTRHWLEALGAAGIPCATVASVPEALRDPHTLARGLLLDVAHPSAGPLKLVGTPLRFGDTPPAPPRPPPRLGEHTAQVLREALALDDAALRRLRDAGAI